jgi:hypothetical protein
MVEIKLNIEQYPKTKLGWWFWECQSLIIHHENELIKLFDLEYVINEKFSLFTTVFKIENSKQAEAVNNNYYQPKLEKLKIYREITD